MNRQDFLFKDFEQKGFFIIFSINYVGKFRESERNSGKYYYECTCVCISSTGSSSQILVKYKFSPQFFFLNTPIIQGYRKSWAGFETAITHKVLDGYTRLAS